MISSQQNFPKSLDKRRKRIDRAWKTKMFSSDFNEILNQGATGILWNSTDKKGSKRGFFTRPLRDQSYNPGGIVQLGNPDVIRLLTPKPTIAMKYI